MEQPRGVMGCDLDVKLGSKFLLGHYLRFYLFVQRLEEQQKARPDRLVYWARLVFIDWPKLWVWTLPRKTSVSFRSGLKGIKKHV
jgi:hypothetical protein